MSRHKTLVLVLAGVLLSPMGARPQDKCLPLSETKKQEILDYLQKKLGVQRALTLKTSEFVPSTCYQKLQFLSRTPTTAFGAVFYLSPDQRFLTPDLLDVTIEPEQQLKAQKVALRKRLKNGNVPSLGSEDATVTITLFFDLQCPYCRQIVKDLIEVVLPSEKDANLIYRHYPLASHEWARTAAIWTSCARMQSNEAFWDFSKYIFENQPKLNAQNIMESLTDEARRFPQFDVNRCKACTADAVNRLMDEDIDLAAALNVTVVPTFFINDVRVEGYVNPEQIRTLIRQVSGTD